MRKALYFILTIFVFISCKKDVTLTFNEEIISSENNAIVEIIYPKASGDKEVSNAINKEIETLIVYSLDMNDSKDSKMSISESIKKFESNFTDFNNQFSESEQQWEALIEGEIIYQSPEIICIAINAYLDTGGAHGNATITFLNFDPNTGKKIEKSSLVNDSKGFSELVRAYFKKEVADEADLSMRDFFFGDDFKLPTTLGFSEEGIIILYNTYDIAPYSDGITEFTIPYEEADTFLTVN